MNLEQIESRKITVGVIGLGYAGLPLAVAFAEVGVNVIGVDISQVRVKAINAGESHTTDVDNSTVAKLVEKGTLRATTEYSALSTADAILICVPTPLSKTQDPDISYIVQSIEGLLSYVTQEALIILQSTTYPGTTEEVLLPRLAAECGKVGEDFFLAFSPERVDPGNRSYNLQNTPRVVGGMTERCGRFAVALFELIANEVIQVSNPKTAEMTKLLENSFRAVNIALANETALICERLGINVWEVIAAASSKPYGFMPFYPGPGIGGHCIPVDPHYLAWKLRTLDYDARFIRLASEVNTSMADHVVRLVSQALNQERKPINGSHILVLGVAYKPDVSDARESPALHIMQELIRQGADLHYHDPLVERCELPDGTIRRTVPHLDTRELDAADLVLIVTAHGTYNWEGIVRHSRLIVDTRNATYAVRDRAIGRVVCL